MMRPHTDPWVRWSLAALGGVLLAAVLIGFVWLPSAQGDFAAQGLWASICRAAGVPGEWRGAATMPAAGGHSTSVVLSERAAGPADEAAVGRGATLALQCTPCHGARGVSGADAPNLAGQYAEVVVKQLVDYQRGDRASAVMQAFAGRLSEPEMRDLAAYFAGLPRPRAAHAGAAAPALVRVGDPMRNIAPCAACHAETGRKLGAAWLDGMPKDYLVAQLKNFAVGARRNDSHAQMRNMARALTPGEIDALAVFYARSPDAESR